MSFSYINKSDEPFVIYDVEVSCGCLKVDWSKKPLRKGEKGQIRVTLDSKGIKGVFDKKLIVKTNARPKLHLLRIKGRFK